MRRATVGILKHPGDVANLGGMWTLRQALALISYLVRAKTPRQLHSPFLFDALRFVFDAKRHYYPFREIEGVRRSLLKSKVRVPQEHLGAPSRKLSRGARTVADVIRVSTSSAYKCQCLFRLSLYLGCQRIIEIGAAAGISTAYLASASARSTVHALEGNRVAADHIRRVANAIELENVHIHQGLFEDTLPALLDEIDHFDMAILDGDHRYEPTLAHFQLLKAKCHDKSVIVVDDIRWSADMWEAWGIICQDSRVTAALDCFSFGMLFFRPEFQDRVDLQIIPCRLPPRVILQ